MMLKIVARSSWYGLSTWAIIKADMESLPLLRCRYTSPDCCGDFYSSHWRARAALLAGKGEARHVPACRGSVGRRVTGGAAGAAPGERNCDESRACCPAHSARQHAAMARHAWNPLFVSGHLSARGRAVPLAVILFAPVPAALAAMPGTLFSCNIHELPHRRHADLMEAPGVFARHSADAGPGGWSTIYAAQML
jgi:hypothetical protein